MVKNTKGGNKAKKHARKNNTDDHQAKTRFSTDPDEVYASCAKLLGNGMCRVMCIDGVERLCIIRNKFRGRGRRGNVLQMGTWCLVGRRSFENAKDNKLEKTDLLEVYGEAEKKQIMQKEIQYKDKWKLFANLGTQFTNTGHDEDLISFHRDVEMPEQEEESNSEDEDGTESSQTNYSYKTPDLGEEINLDDI
jgi:translation initiation factor IF-1